MDVKKLNKTLGNADLILIDQILKNRFHNQMRILDAGCGEGRNMVYFIRQNFNIYGIDHNEEAVSMARILGKSINSAFEIENIQPFAIEDNPFPDHFFDAVMCINVLHSAKDNSAFFNLLDYLIRLLNIGGFLLLSMQSQIGLTQISKESDCYDVSNPEENSDLYFSNDLLSEIKAHDQLIELEPVKTLMIDDNKSNTYLYLQKKC